MWRELIKSTGFLSDVLKAAAIIFARFFFNDVISQLGDTLRLILNLITIGLPLYYTHEWFKAFLRYKRKLDDINNLANIFASRFEEAAQENCTHQQSQNLQQSPLLNEQQIEQLKQLHLKISYDDVKQFSMIRLTGSSMPDLVPQAGIFSAKINHSGKILNLIVMLSTINAVTEYVKLSSSYGVASIDYWAEGYLIPSKTGIDYSVLLVTSFKFCGHNIKF